MGVHRIIIPNIALKFIDKLSNSFLSCLHSIWADYHIILFLGVSPVLMAWLPRLFSKRMVINIDGLEWKRKKWNRFASFYLKLSESLSGNLCHRVVTDSKVIQKYFKHEYGKESTFIAYGADIGRIENIEVLKKYKLKKRSYILQVCRIEPENNVHVVIREYSKLNTQMPLVILGDAPYSEEYKSQLKQIANDRVKFLGGVYGHDYDVIRSNPFCYVHAHEVGGTNPALLESLAAGNCVLALNVPYNLEVIGSAGLSFSMDEDDLRQKLEKTLDDPRLVVEMREKAVSRIKQCYTWEKIIRQYEELFYKVLNNN